MNSTTVRRRRFPFLGIISVVAGAFMPAWVIVASITGGPDAAWVPVILLLAWPFNLVSLALFVVAIASGIYARRNAGADRVLGLIGLILAGAQLLAAAPIVWSLTFGMVGI